MALTRNVGRVRRAAFFRVTCGPAFAISLVRREMPVEPVLSQKCNEPNPNHESKMLDKPANRGAADQRGLARRRNRPIHRERVQFRSHKLSVVFRSVLPGGGRPVFVLGPALRQPAIQCPLFGGHYKCLRQQHQPGGNAESGNADGHEHRSKRQRPRDDEFRGLAERQHPALGYHESGIARKLAAHLHRHDHHHQRHLAIY